MTIAAVLLCALGIGARAGSTPDQPVAVVCNLVDQAAAANRLPAAFLARVLWQESRFHNDATSPAGAQGVAQFMLQTAAERGLADPRDPALAITAAARLLAELTTRFGSLGLAAAAYNAGANRIVKWRHATATLPAETSLYVRAVTGHPVDDWMTPANQMVVGGTSCLATISALAASEPGRHQVRLRLAAWQMRIDRSLARVTGALSDVPLRRPETTDAARSLCSRLRSLGAHCAIYGP